VKYSDKVLFVRAAFSYEMGTRMEWM